MFSVFFRLDAITSIIYILLHVIILQELIFSFNDLITGMGQRGSFYAIPSYVWKPAFPRSLAPYFPPVKWEIREFAL